MIIEKGLIYELGNLWLLNWLLSGTYDRRYTEK